MSSPARPQPRAAPRHLPWALAAVYFLQAISASLAQQLQFANPLPSTQLLHTRVGIVIVYVLNPDGTTATNSSAQIAVTLVGPGMYSSSLTNSATNGVATFDFNSTTLNLAGLYNLTVTSGSLVPAFEHFGVEETLMPPQGAMFAGAWVNPDTNYTGPQSLPELEQICGRTLALSLHYYSWTANDITSSKFLNTVADDITNNRIPLVSWHGTYLTNIVTGQEDATITNAARALASFKGPILLRWFWEMNLIPPDTSAWPYLGYPADFSAPSSDQVVFAQTNFITAWRRIRQIFDANGACNIIWVWNPGAGNDSSPATNSVGGYTDGFYPGDAYVDWIGLDAYNRQNDAFQKTFTVDANYGYSQLIAHAKPLLIGETGAKTNNQIRFLDSAASSLQTNFPQLSGLNYFDAPGNQDAWTLTTEVLPMESQNSALLLTTPMSRLRFRNS